MRERVMMEVAPSSDLAFGYRRTDCPQFLGPIAGRLVRLPSLRMTARLLVSAGASTRLRGRYNPARLAEVPKCRARNHEERRGRSHRAGGEGPPGGSAMSSGDKRL